DDNLNTTLPNGEYTKLVVNGKGELHTFANHMVTGPENIVHEDGTHKVIYYRADEPRLGTEQVPNGNFETGIQEWSPSGGGIIAWSDAGLSLQRVSAATDRATTPITCIPGRTYRVVASVSDGPGTAQIRIGTTPGGSETQAISQLNATTAETWDGTFVATH